MGGLWVLDVPSKAGGPGVSLDRAWEPAQAFRGGPGNGGSCDWGGKDDIDPSSVPAGGLSGATVIDSLDTLYLMELKEEFQEAKAWVEESFHLNVVSRRPPGY